MELTPYIDQLRTDLNTAASAGDEHTQQAAAALSGALEPAVRLMLMTALSDLAAEITTQLPDHVVDVRLDGRELAVTATETSFGQETGTQTASSASSHPLLDSGDISRMTLRLFEQLKSQAEQAASDQGVSLNTFVSQAVQGALRRRHPHDKDHDKDTDSPRGGTHLHRWMEE